ncbi:MAG: DUF2878 domain-containing protein [Pseudomonadales bacterium]
MNPAILANGVLFQLAWFGSVLGGANRSNLWGLPALALLAAQSLRGAHARKDAAWVGAALVTGFLLDTLWIHLGVLDYAGASLAPFWILTLWCALGLTMNHSMIAFAQRPLLGGLLAGVSAPFSYLGGERLGAVVVADPFQLAWVSLTWGALFWLAFCLVRRSRGLNQAPAGVPTPS